MRYLFVGGGSLGHVTPCVAVWRALEKRDPKAQAFFACSNRAEDLEFLKQENLDAKAVASRRLRPWTLPRDLIRSFVWVRKIKPDAVFCKGGAASFPVALAAWMRGVPLIVHDSDAVMGKASKWISGMARVICRGMPGDAGSDKAIFTGNPIRSEVTQGSRERGLFITGIKGDRPVLLVYGGSQGAVALNQAVREHLEELLSFTDIVHLTGKGKEGPPNTDRRYYTAEFAHRDLPHLYAMTDVALSRSGAGAISELAGNGIPAIFVPLPGLAQDHQTANARVAEKWGGGTVLPQSDLQRGLVPAVKALLEDGDRRAALSQKWQSFVSLDAADRIAQLLQKTASERIIG